MAQWPGAGMRSANERMLADAATNRMTHLLRVLRTRYANSTFQEQSADAVLPTPDLETSLRIPQGTFYSTPLLPSIGVNYRTPLPGGSYFLHFHRQILLSSKEIAVPGGTVCPGKQR